MAKGLTDVESPVSLSLKPWPLRASVSQVTVIAHLYTRVAVMRYSGPGTWDEFRNWQLPCDLSLSSFFICFLNNSSGV